MKTSVPLRQQAARLVVGLVTGALVLTGCSVYDAPLPGGADTGDNPIKVKILFRDVLDLVPQSTVKVNDVTVGKVTDIKLKGYIAEATVQLPHDTKLPDNATAHIRQTSLLGEKFISLAPPQEPSSNKLSDGDVIGLDRTGRNPEVEEVFSALALLLNGGGVGQLKTIAEELNMAMDGRETDIKSVLRQISDFMGQLDQNKESVVAALENTNRLAKEIQRQKGTIERTLDDIPDALRSVNRQRDDLVKLLKALSRLSDVGVKVIRASKESTINSLRDLSPVLEAFAAAGQNMPRALQVFLTYPFIDEAVGRDPQVARNLHMGDYTNLSVNLDLNMAALPTLPGLPDQVCDTLDQVRKQVRARARQAADQVITELEKRGGDQLPPELRRAIRSGGKTYDGLVDKITEEFMKQAVKQCRAPDLDAMLRFARGQLDDVLNGLPKPLKEQLAKVLPAVGDIVGGLTGPIFGGGAGGGTGGGGGGTGGTGGTGGGGVLGGVVPRAQLGSDFRKPEPMDPFGLAARGIDPGIGTMLLQGVATTR